MNTELIKALRCKECFDLCNVENCRYHLTNTKSGCKCAIKLMATDAADALEAAEKENAYLKILMENYKARAEAADNRVNELKTAQRWISVEERLPENGIDVLLYWSNDAQNKKYVDMERYHIDHWETLNRPWIRAIAWMPLPEPPKGAQDE